MTSRRIAIFIAGLLIVAVPGTTLADGPVHLDQHGYVPVDEKRVAVAVLADSFEVRCAGSGETVIAGPLTLRRLADPASGDDVYEGDFSALAVPGLYSVHVPGVGDSPTFLVADGAYDTLYRWLLKGLYYQRCGTAISSQYGGDWTHDICHAGGPSVASYDWVTTGGTPGGYRNTIGGWHDAGDYGKYATNNAYTIGVLLQAYELWPGSYAHDDCGIPESGNGVPDLLDEARWSLDWMFTMQDPDGAVRHRESSPWYVDDYIPEEDPLTRYYTDESSDATAVHAAAMAIAARVFAPVDPVFAAACSTSAEDAWAWLGANPDRVPVGGFVNLYGHTGATYILGSETGRRLWAAAEMFRLTGDTGARAFFDAHWGDGLDFNGIWYPDSWGDVANLGAFSYRDAPGATGSVVSGNWWSVENSTLSSAGQWESRRNQDGYRCVAAVDGGSGDYYWGFTGVILRYAWTLLQAYRYGGDPAFEAIAREQLHYILGHNPMGKVYITGIGTRPVLHAHGAWNLAGGYTAIEDSLCNPVPYSLVGGPNHADNSDISPYPAKCYEDIADPDYYYKGNYTLNETSVNIQASLIVLAGYFGDGGDVTTVAGGADLAAGDAPPAHIDRIAPNPFNANLSVRFHLASSGRVDIDVYDIRGRLIDRLEESRFFEAGFHTVRWDGRSDSGEDAPSGVYFVRIHAAGTVDSRKVVLLR